LKKLESGVRATDASLQQLETAINFLKGPEEAAGRMSTSLGSARTAQEGMVSPAQQTAAANRESAAAFDRIVAASSNINANLTGVSTGNFGGSAHAKGGRVGYFTNGGRGTDTIPAMLSAGEHVTNARSSQRFFSQLQAINAGQQPVFRQDGGDTFNTNVGDINVSGAGKPQQTARAIMDSIRREERRGSGR
jgi:uncharacterized phage infection (PIP) family protein YhgE